MRLSTGGEIKHLQGLVRRYEGCPVHLAFEACGFGYEVAWWAREEEIAVTVIVPSRMERAPGWQVKTDRLERPSELQFEESAGSPIPDSTASGAASSSMSSV